MPSFLLIAVKVFDCCVKNPPIESRLTMVDVPSKKLLKSCVFVLITNLIVIM